MITKQFFTYIDDINRRDLLYSSTTIFKIILIIYNIINLFVSKYVIKLTKCTYENNVISANNVVYISINYQELFKILESTKIYHYSMIKKDYPCLFIWY